MTDYQFTFCRATGWAIYEPIAQPWEPWYRFPATHAAAPCLWPVARRFDQHHWNDHVAPALAQSCPGDRYRALDALAAHLHLQRADAQQVSASRVLALGYLPLDTPAAAFALAIERCTDRGWRVSIPRLAAALGLDAGRYLIGRHGPRRMLRVLAEDWLAARSRAARDRVIVQPHVACSVIVQRDRVIMQPRAACSVIVQPRDHAAA